MRVLVVEDDDHIVGALTFTLTQHGHDVNRVATGGAALRDVATAEFVLLDLSLPDLDGYEVCRRIRAEWTVPIIAVTDSNEEIGKVLVLRAGADDCVAKPFGMHELMARIEAVTRRSVPDLLSNGADRRAAASELLRLGPLKVDPLRRWVTLAERPLLLTRKEFDLLAMLIEDPGVVLTREAIISRVWDEDWYGSTRTLDVHIGALRCKLGDKRWIETIRGVGFRLTMPVDQ